MRGMWHIACEKQKQVLYHYVMIDHELKTSIVMEGLA
jgi:hypothetical protein